MPDQCKETYIPYLCSYYQIVLVEMPLYSKAIYLFSFMQYKISLLPIFAQIMAELQYLAWLPKSPIAEES